MQHPSGFLKQPCCSINILLITFLVLVSTMQCSALTLHMILFHVHRNTDKEISLSGSLFTSCLIRNVLLYCSKRSFEPFSWVFWLQSLETMACTNFRGLKNLGWCHVLLLNLQRKRNAALVDDVSLKKSWLFLKVVADTLCWLFMLLSKILCIPFGFLASALFWLLYPLFFCSKEMENYSMMV